jgi:hypothetical protein
MTSPVEELDANRTPFGPWSLHNYAVEAAEPSYDTEIEGFDAMWDRAVTPIYVEMLKTPEGIRAALCLARCLLWDTWMIRDREECWHGLRPTEYLKGRTWAVLDTLPLEYSCWWLDLWRNRSMSDDEIRAVRTDIRRLQREAEHAKNGRQVEGDDGELRPPDPTAATRLAEIKATLRAEWEKASTEVVLTEVGEPIRRWQANWYLVQSDKCLLHHDDICDDRLFTRDEYETHVSRQNGLNGTELAMRHDTDDEGFLTLLIDT